MIPMYYDGFTHELGSGTTVRHKIKGEAVVLEIESPHGEGLAASLTEIEAFKLATSILRECSLLRFGVG